MTEADAIILDGKTFNLSRYKGYIMVLIGATLWGLSGTVAQALFQYEGFHPQWLVVVRMVLSGLLLLLIASIKQNKCQVWAIWKNENDRFRLIIFSFIGMLGVQYTYFEAIQTGNAATATLLQYLGPAFIVLFLAVRFRRFPNFRELVAVSLALFGTFLLVTDGSVQKLTISTVAVAWGLGSAVSLAFYTLYPAGLLERWGSVVVVGWSMVVGGVGLSVINPLWQFQGQHWSLLSVLFVSFVVLFGTLIAFYLYIDSLRFITPTEASLLASAEPLSAALASVFWLHVSFGIFQVMGGLCIIGTVVILSLRPNKNLL
ncbi:Hypothetical protein LUCI_0332 [Lucifera butyrica]|uniref:EamA domain-containing protein n=1 Tax=Lucifera butyrica TaxID=1351585 RepID=A0A498R1T4_9FIRM|nr:DMT family transporter [Lucifera butyrica]VBB05125.1 Hypothetical protein LUCI_0332 [Lucifera butyrica]